MSDEKIYYRRLRGYRYELAQEFIFDTGFTIPSDIHSRIMNAETPPFVQLSSTGRLTIAKFYAWDGPSGPARDTPDFMRGSLVHDALYQLMRIGELSREYRDKADRLLEKICDEDGMSAREASVVYQGVHTFGSLALRMNAGEDRSVVVITAP